MLQELGLKRKSILLLQRLRFRMFFGGSTDMESYFRENDGAVYYI